MQKENLAVERAIWINAPRERVWQAITEPKQLEQWFLPPALGAQLQRDDKGRLSMLMGPMAVEIAVFEDMDAPRCFTSRSLPDQVIATTYLLTEEKDGTSVTVTISGLDSLPDAAAHERLEPLGISWEKALKNLKAYVDGASLPHPEGFIAALYGFRRESKKTLAVERSIWIKAPRERVWRAVTDPEQIEHWFSPGTSWRGTGLEVGATFSVYDPATDSDMYTQMIEKVDAPRQFVTRTVPPDAIYVTTWTLEPENDGTRLTITYSGYELESADSRYTNMEQNAFGFGMMLENLKAAVEGTTLPYPGGF